MSVSPIRVVGVLAALLVGCGSNVTKDGGGPETADPLVGTWIGYAENHTFPSGSDRITVVITQATPAGHVAFGEGPQPAPPQADAGYPPDFEFEGGPGGPIPLPHEGFHYALREGDVDGTRVRFSLAPHELWSEWCALQTSYPLDDSGENYSCLPNWGFGWDEGGCHQTNPDTDEQVERDCGQVQLCMDFVCRCTAEGCAAEDEPVVDFDLQLAGDRLDGSVAELIGLVNVHFQRQ